MKASIAVAASALVSGAFAVARPDLSVFDEVSQLPKIPGLSKISPATLAKAKKIFSYYYPPCSQSCAIGALGAGGFDILSPSPSVICRSGFLDSFKSCAKDACSADLYARVEKVLTNVCYEITPKCALKCVFPLPAGGLQGLLGSSPLAGLIPGAAGGSAGAGDEGSRIRAFAKSSVDMPSCPPFDLYCTCKADYAAWFKQCLTDSCTDPQDVAHQYNTGLTLCANLPPKCSFDCIKTTPNEQGCHPLSDVSCTCSSKVQTALTDCVAKSDCSAEDKASFNTQASSHCKFNQELLATLPEIPAKLAQFNITAPTFIPYSVDGINNALSSLTSGISTFVSGFLGGGGDAGDAASSSDTTTDSGEEPATSGTDTDAAAAPIVAAPPDPAPLSGTANAVPPSATA